MTDMLVRSGLFFVVLVFCLARGVGVGGGGGGGGRGGGSVFLSMLIK